MHVSGALMMNCILRLKKDNPLEIEKYFNHALNELKIHKPAAIQLSLYFADEIIEGRLDPIEGLKKIIFDCIYKYNFFEEYRDFALDGIYFHTLFGLYWEYYLLLEEEGSLDLDKDSSKSIEALLQEIPGEIILELKKWKSKMNGV